MSEVKRFFKLFWAWEDEREEAWLTEMARQGWHLVQPGLGFYPFVQGEPRNMVYRMDFKAAGKDMGEYVQLFADAGWEYVGALGSWQYFRKEIKAGESTEIYTDAASKIQKYQRVIAILVVFLPIYIVMFRRPFADTSPVLNIIGVIMSFFMLLYIYALLRLLGRISALKKQL